MIYLRVTKKDGNQFMNTFPSDFQFPHENDYEFNKDSKFVRYEKGFGVVEIATVNEERLTYTNKNFVPLINALISVVEISISNSSNTAKELADDYLHNIVKIHGNQKSIVERCVRDAEGHANYRDFVSAVESSIQSKPFDYAQDICSLSNEVRLIDYHIGGYRLLQESDALISVTHNHNLRRFLLGLAHLFFDQFTKKNIEFNLYDVNEDFHCSFEYETFNIAMHSFFENAVKYAKPYSKVSVSTSDESGELSFSMVSTRIDKDEREKISERGVWGKYSPEYLRGSGIGMYLIRKALERSKILMTISSDFSNNSKMDGAEYVPNTFTFKFPQFSIH